MGKARVVEARGLRYSYRGGAEALKGIDLAVLEGSRVLIIGSNGSGKTTLLRVILGMLKGYKGEVRVFGYEPYRVPETLRRSISYVPESTKLPGGVRAEDYLFVTSVVRGCGDYRDKADLLGITGGMLKSRIKWLSQGYKRRVLVASGLVCDPRLIVLDEPYANVDVSTRIAVDEALSMLPPKSTLIITSHIVPGKLEVEAIILVDGLIAGRIATLRERALAILDCNGETVLLEDAFSIEKAMEKGCRLAGLKCVTVYDQIRSALYELEKGRVKASWSGSG